MRRSTSPRSTGSWSSTASRSAEPSRCRVGIMKAVVLTGNGGPEVLQVLERPDPPVGPGEVRIAVKAAGINFADTMAGLGMYPDAPKTPCVMGYEVAGLIESVGEEVDGFTSGDRVMAGT